MTTSLTNVYCHGSISSMSYKSLIKLPSQMQFIDSLQSGDPEVMLISRCATPLPNINEVLIKVAAVGINRADLSQRAGEYPPPAGNSLIMGLECAGTIVAVGRNIDTKWLGVKVCSLTNGGAYAEYVNVPLCFCLPIPKKYSLIQAAALPEAAMTVWNNLFMRGHLKNSETLLVHGGTSGIGTTAIQYALAFGCRVIATAGSEIKCQFLKQLGVHLVINYQLEDFVVEVQRFTQRQGVNMVLDIIGGDYTARNIKSLAMEGKIMQISWQQGSQVNIDLIDLSKKRGWLTGSFLRPRSIEEKQEIVDELKQHIWPLYDAGKIYPIIDKTYTYHEIIDAHHYLTQHKNIGKLVFTFPQ